MRRIWAAVCLVLAISAWQLTALKRVSSQVRIQTVSAVTAAALREWDVTLNGMLNSRELVMRVKEPDALIPAGTIERLDQYSRGVRVWGADVTRQQSGGLTTSVFGILYPDVEVETTAAFAEQGAREIIERSTGGTLNDRRLELVIVPNDDGSFVLAWVADIATADDTIKIFVNAKTGGIVRQYSITERQIPNAYVGQGKGVLGDNKKVSTDARSGGYVLFDTLRPPDISTFDMRSNFSRTELFRTGLINLAASDYGFSSTNDWTDGALVDAQVNSSLTYDYYYKRFGRRGLDAQNGRVWNVVHVVSRNNILSASAAAANYYVNAFYNGLTRSMFYGEGLPTSLYYVPTGHWYNYFSGALDIVAHELTHGVTAYSSNLIYLNESGALNEAFSDIMGTGAEFFFQPPGGGPMKADYSIGEDISLPAIPGAPPAGDRSMENPGLYGDPDHYSKRYTGTQDNGGVHTNSGIANQAFYLAIEGGTNRTSRLAVTGVGAANREQIEKIFYRGFTQLLPSNASFSIARAATIQAARDLYGAGSAPERAVTQAWTAVGVN